MAGETVSLSSVAAVRQAYDAPGSGTFWVFFSLTYSSTNNETADVMEAGYLPAYAKPLAVLWGPTDMDTNVSPAAVHKVTVGSLDIATGLTGAQTGTSQIVPVTSTAMATAAQTAAALVKVTTTTAAATGAAGTATLGILCQRVAA